MQLFTTGPCKLRMDGTTIFNGDGDGSCVKTYTNDDIKEYGKVWTGFEPSKFILLFFIESF